MREAFKVGDKAVYPAHGVGEVAAIEKSFDPTALSKPSTHSPNSRRWNEDHGSDRQHPTGWSARSHQQGKVEKVLKNFEGKVTKQILHGTADTASTWKRSRPVVSMRWLKFFATSTSSKLIKTFHFASSSYSTRQRSSRS